MDSYVFEIKPTRNELFFKHLKLKNKTKKIILKHEPSSAEKWQDHNFKKNPGYKPIWSCHGYGGRCQMCKSDFGISEVQAKRNLQQNADSCKKEVERWEN